MDTIQKSKELGTYLVLQSQDDKNFDQENNPAIKTGLFEMQLNHRKTWFSASCAESHQS